MVILGVRDELVSGLGKNECQIPVFLIGFGALLIALQTFAFCFIGKTSAKRQLAQLHARIAKLEASGTEPDEPATDE